MLQGIVNFFDYFLTFYRPKHHWGNLDKITDGLKKRVSCSSIPRKFKVRTTELQFSEKLTSQQSGLKEMINEIS